MYVGYTGIIEKIMARDGKNVIFFVRLMNNAVGEPVPSTINEDLKKLNGNSCQFLEGLDRKYLNFLQCRASYIQSETSKIAQDKYNVRKNKCDAFTSSGATNPTGDATGDATTNATTDVASTDVTTNVASTNATTNVASTDATTGDATTNATTNVATTNATTGDATTNATTNVASTDTSGDAVVQPRTKKARII